MYKYSKVWTDASTNSNGKPKQGKMSLFHKWGKTQQTKTEMGFNNIRQICTVATQHSLAKWLLTWGGLSFPIYLFINMTVLKKYIILIILLSSFRWWTPSFLYVLGHSVTFSRQLEPHHLIILHFELCHTLWIHLVTDLQHLGQRMTGNIWCTL